MAIGTAISDIRRFDGTLAESLARKENLLQTLIRGNKNSMDLGYGCTYESWATTKTDKAIFFISPEQKGECTIL